MKKTDHTLKTCKESAQNFTTKMGWKKGDRKAYESAIDGGWYDECVAHMPSREASNIVWTLEKCKESAIRFKTKVEWGEGDSAAYAVARRKRWLTECCSHMTPVKKGRKPLPKEPKQEPKTTSKKPSTVSTPKQRKPRTPKWTLEKCTESASNYTTKKDWSEGDNPAYVAARRNKWVEQCCAHMVSASLIWTKGACIEDAKCYPSKLAWQKGNQSAYKSAMENGWLDECKTKKKR
ncbi:hypothetical protein [Vibrio crassostreae]|uniref:hypothetical protein n=1 Tax=Vibrio crassostreae TaxID=246167 RepID=UPI001B311FED|nr:hypothetical protein [Vibrio crassostreae]